MAELLVDFITSWTDTRRRRAGRVVGSRRSRVPGLARAVTGSNGTILMGATTYRLMSEFAADDEGVEGWARSKVVFSSTPEEPLTWANTRLVAGMRSKRSGR